MKILSMALIAAALMSAGAAEVRAQSHTLSGTVSEVDAAGSRPLAGAEVRLSPGDYRAVSQASGVYTISGVPRGAYTARITAPNHLPATSAIIVDRDMNLNFTLAVSQVVGVEVRGVVTESGSFGTRALAGATVRFEPGGHSATTDGSGRYVLTGVNAGSYRATASAPGHRSMSQNVIVRPGIEVNFNLPVVTSDSDERVDITGIVTESGSFGTRALAGATVRFEPGGYVATSDASGRYSLSDLTVGTYRVTASAAGHRTVTVTVGVRSQGQEVRIDLPVGDDRGDGGDVARSGIIRGADGRGIAGAQIRITPGNAVMTTGSDGSFTLPTLKSGKYMVHVRAKGYVPVNERVTVSGNGTISRSLDITLRPVGQGRRENDDDDDDDDRLERRDRDDDDDDDRYEDGDRDDDGDRGGKEKQKQKKSKKGKAERVKKDTRSGDAGGAVRGGTSRDGSVESGAGSGKSGRHGRSK